MKNTKTIKYKDLSFMCKLGVVGGIAFVGYMGTLFAIGFIAGVLGV